LSFWDLQQLALISIYEAYIFYFISPEFPYWGDLDNFLKVHGKNIAINFFPLILGTHFFRIFLKRIALNTIWMMV